MDSRLWHTVSEWLLDPTVGKIVAVIAGIIIINVLTRTMRRVLLGHIENSDTRYRLRKLVNAAGALVSINPGHGGFQ